LTPIRRWMSVPVAMASKLAIMRLRRARDGR
jgi:hypothetical protein